MKKILTLLLSIAMIIFSSSICFAESLPEEISFESDLSLSELEGKTLAEKKAILNLSTDDIEAITITKNQSDESIKEDYVNLTEKEVPTEIEKDGKKYKLVEGSEKWSETKRDAAVATRRILQMQRPDFPMTLTDTVEFPKGETQTVTLQLNSVTQDTDYTTTVEAPVTYTGTYETDEYYLGDVLLSGSSAPALAGYEDVILEYLGLSDYKNSCEVTGSRWTSNFADGKRTGIYTVKLTGGAWDATYVEDLTSAELTTVYDVSATYEPLTSKYVARVVYKAAAREEAQNESTIEVETLLKIGAGILIFAITIAAVIFFAKKKKNKETK